MAARARSVLRSERRRTLALLNSSEYGRERLRELRDLKPETLEDVSLDRPDALQEINERALRALMDGVLDVVPQLDRRMIETVTVDTDTTSASTRSFPDGSHLIMVSDAMMTLVDLLGALLSAWSRSKGRTRITSSLRRTFQARRSSELTATDPVILGGAASLRYYIVHQRLWASSAKVSTDVNTHAAMHDTERGFGAWALFYVLAHELGHIALAHAKYARPRAADAQRQNELAADDFAFPICTSLFGGGSEAGNVTAIVATIAQSAIAISTDPLFVRSPETHPPFQDRLHRIATLNPAQMETVTNAYWGFTEMVSRGIDVGTPLPEQYWTAMLARPEFDSRHHDASYFNMIRGMDMVSGWTPEQAWRCIEDMTDAEAPQSVQDDIGNADIPAVARAIGHLAHDDVASAVDALGLRCATAILNRDLPLSFHALVEGLLDSEALGGQDSNPGLHLRTIAFILAHLAAPLVTRSEGN